MADLVLSRVRFRSISAAPASTTSMNRPAADVVSIALSAPRKNTHQRTRDRLVAIGLLDSERVAVSKPLADHLEDFGAALAAKDCSSQYVALVKGRAKRGIDACGFRFYGDITASKVMTHLSGLRTDTDEKRGISAQTFNFYQQAVKQLCRWMVKDRRASDNPVSHLEQFTFSRQDIRSA